MIRQAHTYLVGALSGVVLIGIAIAAFVVLVSAQVFHDLPIPALSSSDQKAAAVSQAKALNGSPNTGAVATTGTPLTSQGNTNPNPTGPQNGQAGAPASNGGKQRQSNAAAPAQDATGPAEVVETPEAASLGTTSEGETSAPSSSGGNSGGSRKSQPSSQPTSPSSSNPGSVSGNSPTTSSGSSGGNSSGGNSGGSSGTSTGAPTTTSGGSGSGSTTPPATGTSGGGETPVVEVPATPVTTAKPSEALNESVGGVVGTVDEATGGTLTETGVKEVTEEVVKGLTGPESLVGKTVDGVGEVVGGLVGGNGQ
jgi:hypothetical protein